MCWQLLLFAASSSSSAPAACTKVTKCTECQQALRAAQSVDFTLQSLYNRRERLGTHSLRAVLLPPSSLPHVHALCALCLRRCRSVSVYAARRGEAGVCVCVCVCVCARRVTCARASPLPRKSIQISNNGSTLHCRSRRRHQRSAICIFFSSFSCTLVLSLAFGGAFALVCFIIHDAAALMRSPQLPMCVCVCLCKLPTPTHLQKATKRMQFTVASISRRL